MALIVLLLFSFLFAPFCSGFEVPFAENDPSRQTCSGMWGSQSTYINVTFDDTSRGQLAFVIYEWADAKYLGKVTDRKDNFSFKTFVCTTLALKKRLCTQEQLGHFIFDLPPGKSLDDTSFWSSSLDFSANRTTTAQELTSSINELWNDAKGTSTSLTSEHASLSERRQVAKTTVHLPHVHRQGSNSSSLYIYTGPIQYPVRKTGYYCVVAVPLVVSPESRAQSSYSGTIYFKNTFQGNLPATDYPKLNFYFAMFLVYSAFAVAWGWLCYKHMHELLPIQYYLSSLVFLLVIEMAATWAYYKYLNTHGKTSGSTVFIFLIVVAILDAARNSMSLFMLLVVSLGLSVVSESLGPTMLKCKLLAGAHFIFGVMYAIGIVELQLESASALILLLFLIPHAFTLSGFFIWIMYSLNATIAHLRARKQRYKLRMFQRLYYILLLTILVIAIFFVVSTMSFSGRFAEDFAANSWRVRWWLLDGWLSLLYLAAFASITFLWRPSANNRRYGHHSSSCFPYTNLSSSLFTLAMSDELAQDEEDAEDYDPESAIHRSQTRDDDEATLVGERRERRGSLTEQHVVFEIGDEDEDEEEVKLKQPRLSGQNAQHGREEEREGLIGGEQTRGGND